MITVNVNAFARFLRDVSIRKTKEHYADALSEVGSAAAPRERLNKACATEIGKIAAVFHTFDHVFLGLVADTVRRVKLLNPKLDAELRQALGLLARENVADRRTVTYGVVAMNLW